MLEIDDLLSMSISNMSGNISSYKTRKTKKTIYKANHCALHWHCRMRTHYHLKQLNCSQALHTNKTHLTKKQPSNQKV